MSPVEDWYGERPRRLERDPSSTGVRPRRVLLAEALRAPCSFGEDPDDVSLARERHRVVDRVRVAFAAADGEDADAAEKRRRQCVEQLSLSHPAELPRVERVREREAVEVRELVRGEDEAAVRAHVLEAGHARPEDEPHERPGDAGDDSVQGRLLRHCPPLRLSGLHRGCLPRLLSAGKARVRGSSPAAGAYASSYSS
jgi:hypothetical protein